MSVAGWVLGSLRNGGKYQVTVLVGYARLYWGVNADGYLVH
jgi:hypothetical protein